jgi:hypothetical protein
MIESGCPLRGGDDEHTRLKAGYLPVIAGIFWFGVIFFMGGRTIGHQERIPECYLQKTGFISSA